MFTQIKTLSLVALIALAGPGFAQETPIEEPAADAAEADIPEGISMGEEVVVGPQVGQQYIVEEFGSWALRCLKVEEGDDPCHLFQGLTDRDDQPVAEISLYPLADGGRAAAAATIVAPLETLLTANLQLNVDGGQNRVYPFTFCNAAGCVARLGFTQEEVDQFKRGAKATLILVPAGAPDVEVDLDVSLTGFTAGFAAVGSR